MRGLRRRRHGVGQEQAAWAGWMRSSFCFLTTPGRARGRSGGWKGRSGGWRGRRVKFLNASGDDGTVGLAAKDQIRLGTWLDPDRYLGILGSDDSGRVFQL